MWHEQRGPTALRDILHRPVDLSQPALFGNDASVLVAVAVAQIARAGEQQEEILRLLFQEGLDVYECSHVFAVGPVAHGILSRRHHARLLLNYYPLLSDFGHSAWPHWPLRSYLSDMSAVEESDQRQLELVRILLSTPGMPVNSPTGDDSLLRYVADPDLLALLLSHPCIDVNRRFAAGSHTALTLLLAAAVDADPDGNRPCLLAAIKLLLKHPEVDINAADGHGFTPLMLAAEGGLGGVARLILSRKGVDVNSANLFLDSALDIAERNRHDTIVTMLVSRGAVSGRRLTRALLKRKAEG